MKLNLSLLALLIVFSGTSQSYAVKKSDILLLNRATYENPVVEGKRLLPNRVYMKYHKPLKRWVFVKSTALGRLPSPIELIRAGSVVNGHMIGAKRPFTKYELTKKGDWITSRKPLRLSVVTPGDKVVVKTLTYAKKSPVKAAAKF